MRIGEHKYKYKKNDGKGAHCSKANQGRWLRVYELREGCLLPLQSAVMSHLRPLHQYRDENGDPVIHLDMPTIQEIGNGMYIRQAKNKRYGKQAVEGQVTYLSQPKKKTWE